MMQEGMSIAYLSKALAQKHLGLITYEKELLVVIIATQKWCSYLLGHYFIIKTDHEALEHLMDQKITTNLQQKWLSKLLGYDHSVQYKKGKENHVADALSRLHEESKIHAMIHVVKPKWKEELDNSLSADADANNSIAKLIIDPNSVAGYTFNNGELKQLGKYYVGSGTDLRKQLCEVLHNSPEEGHSGIAATTKKIERIFFQPGLKSDLITFIKECDICQRNKIEHSLPLGLLQPIAIPNGAWEVITMDFVEGLPKSRGKDTILVVIDKFSK